MFTHPYMKGEHLNTNITTSQTEQEKHLTAYQLLEFRLSLFFGVDVCIFRFTLRPDELMKGLCRCYLHKDLLSKHIRGHLLD